MQKLIRTRKVKIQNRAGEWIKERDAARRLEEGESVCVHSRLFAEGIAPGVISKPSARDVQRIRDAVLFEDDHCIVINKPSGIAVQGGSKIPAGKHLDRIMTHVVSAGTSVRLVHRLDRETSGCLVMAKSRGSAAALATAFQEGRVEKTYVALVAGHIPQKAGTSASRTRSSTNPQCNEQRIPVRRVRMRVRREETRILTCLTRIVARILTCLIIIPTV